MEKMKEYKFSNLNVKTGGEDFLISGTAFYLIEEFDDGNEAGFERVEILDAIGKDGYVTSAECKQYIAEDAVKYFNQDSTLCRRLGY